MKKYDLEKMKENIDNSCPRFNYVIALCCTLIFVGYLTDLGLENGYAYAITNLVFCCLLGYLFGWLIECLIFGILKYMKRRKEKKQDENK